LICGNIIHRNHHCFNCVTQQHLLLLQDRFGGTEMSGLFKGVPLAAILGLVIGRLACADTIDMPPAERFAAPEADPAYSQFAPLPQYDPPLRLALALDRERRRAAPPLSEGTQERAAVQLTAQTSPLRTAALARLQEPDVKLTEQAGNNGALTLGKTLTANADAVGTWEITPGDRTLNTTLARWSASAGWQLVWDLEVDYPIETRAVLEGTFEEAVAAVTQSLATASVPVQATFYAGNRVLRIVAKGSK
jgi:hypothetical protein